METVQRYTKLNINGMHYVRNVKNESLEDAAVLVIDNNNKPVKRVYYYLKHLKENGNALNSQKRAAYDLCYFLDFLMFNNLDEEILKRDDLIKFVNPYLMIINPKHKFEDCIERSMGKKIPILDEYMKNNISVLYNNSIGLDSESILRIMNNVKEYLIFLKEKNLKNVQIDDLFKKKIKNLDRNRFLGYLGERQIITYSISPILKAANLPLRNNIISPIEIDVLFEKDEEEKFFQVLSTKDKWISYKLLFYLINQTGLRVAEALAIKIFEYPKVKRRIELSKIVSDIKLIDIKENIWNVNVIVRHDSPPDLKVKFGKERVVTFSDMSMIFKNLFEQYLSYRSYILRRKGNITEYLFINSNGKRLKYGSAEKTFRKALTIAKLDNRIGKLTIHSLRHGYASKWIKNAYETKKDVELYILADLLGHSSPAITKKTYYHLFQEDKRELLNKMEKSNYYIDKGDDK